MDRAAQKAGRTYSGVEGFAMQDASLQESMGPIVDRTKENLVSTDNGIIMARQRLLRAVKALIETGVVPPGVDARCISRVRSAAVVLPPDQPFKDGAREALIAHPGVAPASGMKIPTPKSQYPNPKRPIGHDRSPSRVGIWDLDVGIWDFRAHAI